MVSSSQAQLRRLTCQQHSPNSSSHQRSRQNTTTSINSIPLSSQSSSIPIKSNRQEKRPHFFFANRHENRLMNSKNNNYYSSKLHQTVNNCEKFLPDQELTNASKENDLLLIHASQSTRLI